MADVGPTKGDSRSWFGDGRGQMMVVMSLVLAVLFVAMALYLNTAIYTENQATQKADISGADGAVSYTESVEDGVGGALEYVNEHNNTAVDSDVEDHGDMHEELATDVERWSDSTQRLEATRSTSANVSLRESTEGTRIVQDDDREFTNESETEDWTVVEQTEDVRNFRMTITDPGGLHSEDPDQVYGAGAFNVTFAGSELRHVHVHGTPDGTVSATITDGGGNTLDTCGVDDAADWVTVDPTRGELVSQTGETVTCEGFGEHVFGELSGGYSIEYDDSSNAEGTYELVVPDSATVDDGYGNYETPTDSPYTTDAIYSAEVHLVYETPRISYATELRIAPGEPDV